MGLPAATVDSTADNTPPHIPTPPGTAFQKPPANKATIKLGSPTVKINGKMAARHGDIATTCNDPADLPNGQVIAVAHGLHRLKRRSYAESISGCRVGISRSRPCAGG